LKYLSCDEGGSDIEKGDPIKLVFGYAQLADSTVDHVDFVAMQDYDGIDGIGKLLAVSTKGVEFEAKTEADIAPADINEAFNLTDTGLVANNSGYGDVFRGVEVVGGLEDRTVRGYFLDRVSTANSA
jgi:hypothetical protein